MPEARWQKRCPVQIALDDAARARLRRHAMHVAAAFRTLLTLPGGVAAAELHLANYIEEIVGAALGLGSASPLPLDPDKCHVLPFFYLCL